MRVFRFRRFSTRLLALVLGLFFTAFGATWWLVSREALRTAIHHSELSLETGGRFFDAATRLRLEALTSGARQLSNDYAFKTVEPTGDADTLASILHNYTRRIDAPVIAYFKRDGSLVANSEPEMTMSNENAGPFAYLIRTATEAERDEASGLSYLDKKLHVLVVVPYYAPFPRVEGWFGLAFPLNRPFAEAVKRATGVEVTFVATENPAAPGVLATTLNDPDAAIAARAAVENLARNERLALIPLSDDRHVTLFKRHEMLAEDTISIVLQRPLSPQLAGARELQNFLLLVSAATLAIATLIALGIARGVSQPVLALAEHTKHVAAGDYARRIELRREDELGQLANAFNAMSAGLEERDRIRDLLDKNVSPEVAAQLLRDGAALGGEEREVTILFADLRGFTTLSEQFSPRELLTLLNRYFDRMSTEIERHGGVIDKFLGDGIMALFGAPVSQGDAADRALAAALAMERAFAALNRELVAEGHKPLALGIGVNTAHVIAGNMGSHRRLNYSVVGDGVNVAARLESQTRTAAFNTNIITSAATIAALREKEKFPVRALGAVQVKGRNEPVEIFAVEQL